MREMFSCVYFFHIIIPRQGICIIYQQNLVHIYLRTFSEQNQTLCAYVHTSQPFLLWLALGLNIINP